MKVRGAENGEQKTLQTAICNAKELHIIANFTRKREPNSLLITLVTCNESHLLVTMTTQGANTANAILAGFRKMNLRKNEVNGKQSFHSPQQRRRKLPQALPTLDESASMLSAEGFSLEFDPANKPQGSSFEQSQNTLATAECSESSEFFSYHSDGEEEDIITEHPPTPRGQVSADLYHDHGVGFQTPKYPEVFESFFPGSPMAKRRRRATLPESVQRGMIEAIPRPPLALA